MKKILLSLLLVIGLLFVPTNVSAAGLNSSLTGKTTVTVGSEITVSARISGSKIYIVKGSISSTNSSVLSGGGSLYKKADLMENPNGFSSASKPIKFIAKSVGQVKIVFSDDGIGRDVDDNPLSFSQTTLTINVVAKQTSNNESSGNTSSKPSQNSNISSKPVDDQKSKINDLSHLSISQGKLNPEFSASRTTYNVDLPGSVNEIVIDAKAKDTKAKVSGIGKKDLKAGDNSFKVVCTAENGSSKTYTLHVNVDEAPLVYTKLDDKNLGVVRVLDNVKAPNGFEASIIKLEGQDINGFKNKQTNLELAYLVDEAGNKEFYIIENDKVLSQFKPINVNNKDYYAIKAPSDLKGVEGLKTSKVKIGDVELDGWVFEDEVHKNYSVVYLMNSDGQAQLYIYEATEGTLQLYTPFESQESMTPLTVVFIGTTALASVLAITGFVLYFNFKKKSVRAIKEYYDRKNQG